MYSATVRFNSYLAFMVFAVVVICGCRTTGLTSKAASTLRLHIEVSPDGTPRNLAVPIFRERPVLIYIEKEPIVHELMIDEAKLVEAHDGFSIQVKFNSQGAGLLTNYALSYKGRRVAIFSQFGDAASQARWLAAPLMSQCITNGVLTFTPDATRNEAERIVLGLNNVAKTVKKRRL